MQLEARFGPLSSVPGAALDTPSPEPLGQLFLELLKPRSLQELGLED